MVTTGILPLQGKIPMVEPGIEPGTSWLVVRSSDHQTTRLIIENEVFHGVKEERNIIQAIEQQKANRIGHNLRWNCFLKHVIEGKIEGKKRRRTRRKQLLDDLKKVEDAGTLKKKHQIAIWRNVFGRCYVPVTGQTM